MQTFDFARNGTTTSGFWLYLEAVLAMDDQMGIVIDNDVTIVGVKVRTKQDFTGDLDFHDGATKLTTLASWSSNKVLGDMTLDYDVTGDSTKPYKVEIQNITSGTLEDPYGVVYYRRRAT